ncbi:hypothetical protein HK101_009950 [Irineochytrium annulatum]|nr:hypothetical protein HK101_009950 [Irineochytrium annulatum]
MSSKTQQVQAQVDDVVNIMRDNVQKATQRGEDLDVLQSRTEELQTSSAGFAAKSKEVRKKMFFKDMKMKLILGGVIFIVVAIIIGSVWGSLSRGGNHGNITVPNPSSSAAEPSATPSQ